MRFFRTTHQDHRRETHRGSQASARVRLFSERGASSPRAAVAFSALSAVTWLREKASGLVGWIMVRWITTGRQSAAAETPWTFRELNGR
jgi:hypothetical protein